MFSPRDVSHESYGKPAGLVMSSSGAVARRPRPPQRKHRGTRRQVVTSGVKLDHILQESPHVLFDLKQTDSNAKGKSDAVRGAAPVGTPRGPTVPELKLKIHAPVQPSRPPPAAYGRRQRTPRLKPGSASLRPHGLEPSASHTGESCWGRDAASRVNARASLHFPYLALFVLQATPYAHHLLLHRLIVRVVSALRPPLANVWSPSCLRTPGSSVVSRPVPSLWNACAVSTATRI